MMCRIKLKLNKHNECIYHDRIKLDKKEREDQSSLNKIRKKTFQYF